VVRYIEVWDVSQRLIYLFKVNKNRSRWRYQDVCKHKTLYNILALNAQLDTFTSILSAYATSSFVFVLLAYRFHLSAVLSPLVHLLNLYLQDVKRQLCKVVRCCVRYIDREEKVTVAFHT
jgi:hypothetical protein